ncbi:MAG: hypothetical protein KF690_05945 [Bacteroidetes bacterium]|nr:hypothetical protein [Bacteroidota bacterium]
MGRRTERIFTPDASRLRPLLGQKVDVVLANGRTYYGRIEAVQPDGLQLHTVHSNLQLRKLYFGRVIHWSDIAVVIHTPWQAW